MRPRVHKIGTIDCDLVETNPVVFQGTLYRFEYVRAGYGPNTTGDSYFRLVEPRTGRVTPPFGHGLHMGCAFVDGDTVYVSAVNRWDGERVDILASRDLETWRSWNALDLPGYGMFNTSVCHTDDGYAMMFEVGGPPEICGVRFTALFAFSKDMKTWEIAPADCNYARDRYTAPHCLRWMGGHFYNFYLECSDEYEQRVVRSRDLVRWEPSPLNPVLRASPEDRIPANPARVGRSLERLASARNINNSDIDFCEHEGALVINYSWGNQEGVEHLAEARYEGTLREFLAGWFP